MRRTSLALCLALSLFSLPASADAARPRRDFDWSVITDTAPWGGRAGLQAVRLDGALYVLGGRTPRPPQFPPIPGDSDIWGDVWRSEDDGATWTRILETNDATHWPARAYFQALKKGGQMYVLGGQNFRLIPNPACPDPRAGCAPFISASDFFDDVWRSSDGINWQSLTDSAGWSGRAGLMAATFKGRLFVFGGSRNDDSSIIGGPPQRLYFNDVWSSTDGATWRKVLDHAPWSPRAGGAVTVKDGWLYLLGGEAGFLCAPQPCQLPYYNDVWRTRDGVTWELVTAAAGWSPRPGHQCVTLGNRIVCFGGFGLPVNPVDMWSSRTGSDWTRLPDAPWNATSPDGAKYDFDALVVPAGPNRRGSAILTFGGDRETFDFTDPLNYLRVDDEVWRYAPTWAENAGGPEEDGDAPASTNSAPRSETPEVGPGALRLVASPVEAGSGRITLRYALREAGRVRLVIYDVAGRLVETLVDESQEAGERQADWSPNAGAGAHAPAGIYFARLEAGGISTAARVLVLPN